VNGWQRKEIRSGCGDVRRTFDVIAEGCRVLPERGFGSGVESVVVVVGSILVVTGTGCSSGQCSGCQWHCLCCSGLAE